MAAADTRASGMRDANRRPGAFAQARGVARAELRRLLRERGVAFALGIVLLLAVVSLLVTVQRNAAANAQQAAHAAAADQDWRVQPDRHPHRVVHFGDFVFKPSSPLASIDWGVESHAGRSIFLEGHRQNTANFNEAGQGGALLRFGQLTPATIVLQLLPLVLIFVGFSAVASERQSGALQMLIVGGAHGRAVVAGKTAALSLFALAALVPLLPALVWIGIAAPEQLARGALLFAVYALYLVVCCGLVIAVSSIARSAYAALLALLCAWVMACVVLPRAAPTLAGFAYPAPTRIESEMRAEAALKKIGDSHNPDDPYFAEFRARTLARYGVQRVEDMPVNYGGLLMIEGERLTSEIHAREVAALHARHAEQNRMVDALAWLAPPLAAAVASRSLAGTDADHHRRFTDAAERRRYQMVQALNRLHADEIRYENDREQRLHAAHWRDIPREDVASPGLRFAAPRLLPALAALLLWLSATLALLAWCGRRLERDA
jgi:ABC-2 type transport system permease protein